MATGSVKASGPNKVITKLSGKLLKVLPEVYKGDFIAKCQLQFDMAPMIPSGEAINVLWN